MPMERYVADNASCLKTENIEGELWEIVIAKDGKKHKFMTKYAVYTSEQKFKDLREYYKGVLNELKKPFKKIY